MVDDHDEERGGRGLLVQGGVAVSGGSGVNIKFHVPCLAGARLALPRDECHCEGPSRAAVIEPVGL